jgi:oxygen-independent coproporphyrinogen III oxidase
MLYIHIPFCKQACHYCDFHFSTNLANMNKMVDAICAEMATRKAYLSNNILETIYFGGGTPSMLNKNHLDKIFNSISNNFTIATSAEITLEANPDDLTIEKLALFKNYGINRLSVGIQTFDGAQLKFMNRAHNETEALHCIEMAQKVGFENFSIDLIYGIPANSHSVLNNDIAIATQLGVNHISAYCLTIEPKTTFGKWVQSKKMAEIDDEFASEQFEILMSAMAQANFEQYEISNFAKNGHYSKHNSQYWTGNHYLGIGPSAHSFDGTSRQANISSNNLYIKGIEENNYRFTAETLSKTDIINEYLLTSLRTIWGTQLTKLDQLSAGNFWLQNEDTLNHYANKNWLEIKDKKIILTKNGKFFADQIAANLFME